MLHQSTSFIESIRGLMMRPNLTLKDFSSIFNYDKMGTVEYEKISTSVLYIAEQSNYYVPFSIDTEYGTLRFEDSNNASIHLSMPNGATVVLSFMYRVDNFPAIQFVYNCRNNTIVYHTRNISLQELGPTNFDFTFVSSNVRDMLSHRLFEIYQRSYKDEGNTGNSVHRN